jgi:hypothetical protein
MILYVCEKCGKWQDVSIAKVVAAMWNSTIGLYRNIMAPSPDEHAVRCPTCQSVMSLVDPSDRLVVVKEHQSCLVISSSHS